MSMSQEAQSILVVGGGVIGLSCAYYLAKTGRKVRVIERDSTLLSGSSEGNAGMIVPSHFIPLAAPGVIGQGLKWMLNPKSPFFLRPRLDLDLVRWVWTFFRHANADHVKKNETLLRDLGLESRRLHIELAKSEGYSLVQKGLLMLCQSEKGLEEEIEMSREAERLGLEVKAFDAGELKAYEPHAQIEARGGVWFGQDCHLSPMDFLSALKKAIGKLGGEFLEERVTDFKYSGAKVMGLEFESGDVIEGDQIVLAGGIATSSLSARLGVKMPMQGGKGYSLTLQKPRKSLELCSLLKEGRVAVTPMGQKLRVAGTMEICGEESAINPLRLQGVIESFCRFYPEFQASDFSGIEPWVGLRPCSPDGLPYLGKLSAHENVTIASGHSMLGLSLAPITGMLVNQLVTGENSLIDYKALDPERFS